MRNKSLLSKRMIWLSFFISLFIVFSCNNTTESGTADSGGSTVSASSTDTRTPSVSATGVQQFFHFRIDSAILVDSFFRKAASPPFKKIVFNFKINDYTDVPRSLSLLGHAAKENNDLIDYDPEEVARLGNREDINADNLLYSTLEFHRRKIENLVGANGTGKSYQYLVFIPYIETRNGQKYLSYKVQKRPIDPNADEPTENLNPCPPFRPE